LATKSDRDGRRNDVDERALEELSDGVEMTSEQRKNTRRSVRIGTNLGELLRKYNAGIVAESSVANSGKTGEGKVQ